MSKQNYRLYLQRGPEPGKVYDLTLESITIGRDPMADITITDPEVSRQHVRLTTTPTGYAIQDLGSTNGTFVDGKRLGGEPVDLQVGQTITMGAGVALRFQQEQEYEDMPTMLDGSTALSALEIEELSQPAFEQPVVDAVDEQQEFVEGEISDLEKPEDNYQEEVEDIPPVSQFADQSSEPETVDDYGTPEFEDQGNFIQDELYGELDDGEAGSEPVIIPHKGEALPDEQNQESKRRTPVMIAAVILLILCCCCSFVLFIYYYGGDWLLRQMGLLP